MKWTQLSAVAHGIGLSALAAGSLSCASQDADGTMLESTLSAIVVGSPIKGVQSGRCLDVTGNDPTAGTPLIIWDCNGQGNQRFEFTAAGELRTFDGSVCLQPAGGATAAQTRVVVGPCSNRAIEQWRRSSNRTITHVSSGLCLDVRGNNVENLAPIDIYPCNGGANQQFEVAAAADTQPPTAPTNARVSDLTCSSANLAWNASTDNVAVASYDIYHDGQLVQSVGPTTLATPIAVLAGVTWGFYVNARDAAGNVSQASATVPVTPPQCQVDTTPPSTPTNLSASVSGTSVTLRWTASSDNSIVRSYDIYRDGSSTPVGTVSGSGATLPATAFVDSGLSATTNYTYVVRARDAQGNVSGPSNSVTATTGASCTNAICGAIQTATDSDIPWGLVSLPDGTVLYGRRDAQNLVRLDPATGVTTDAGKLQNVQSTDGEGGLMGLALGPNFAADRWVYVMHTSPDDNRIVRVKLGSDNKLDNASLQVLVSGILRNKFHNGGRLRFGPDGKLYASTGDGQNAAIAQNTSNLAGKVLRLNTDGSTPSDNPFGNLVWSYGHRNPQGLAFDSQGRLWEQEFGNSVMDETNLIEKGGNYGWPDCEGTVSQGGAGCGTAGFIAPKRTYPTAEGSCSGIAVVRNVLYVACARGARLYREVIEGTSLTNVQQFFVGTYGRLRTVEPTLDGNLWLTTTNRGDKDSIPNNSDEKVFKVLLGR